MCVLVCVCFAKDEPLYEFLSNVLASCSGLQQVANCSNEDDLKSLGLNFTAEVEHFGSVVVTELEPGGYGREVTLANRDLYIQKVLEYHLEGLLCMRTLYSV